MRTAQGPGVGTRKWPFRRLGQHRKRRALQRVGGKKNLFILNAYPSRSLQEARQST